MAVEKIINTDWRDNSLPECMLYMLNNEIMCDVKFHVGGEKKQIRVHKNMLSSRSTVFHTMFEGSSQEKGVISIPDINESTFRELLKYIYTDELSISNDNVKEMLYVSNKYMITKIKNECEAVLQRTALTPDAVKTLQTAYEYNLDSLLIRSFSFLEQNTFRCLSSDYALDLSKDCLELILKSEYLNCTETELCSFFLKWTRNQCALAKVEANGKNMRTMAGNLLFLVRFPLVDLKIFTKDVSTTGLLTPNEALSIYQCIGGVLVENLLFSNEKRKTVAEREILTVTRFQEVSPGWQTNIVEALKFETSKDIWLKGVVIGSLNPFQHQIQHYNPPYVKCITFEVLSANDTDIYCCMCHVTPSPPQPKLTEVTFPQPVKISKYTKYTIKMEGMYEPSYYSANCVKSVSICDVAFRFEKSPLCASGTDESQGQFAGFLFSI